MLVSGNHVTIGYHLMNYDIIATHCSRDVPRSNNINRLKNMFSNVTVIDALDASAHDNIFSHVINQHHVPVQMEHTGKRTVGFLGCWLSFIFTLKYIYDVYDYDTPVVMIQDDLVIPEGFDFKNDKWSERGRMYKLSQWDEMYVVDKLAAKQFLTMLYKKPICWHGQDRWIMQHMNPIYLKYLWSHESEKKLSLQSHTNDGLIKKSCKIIHKYRWRINRDFDCDDPGSLINNTIFRKKQDVVSLENILT